MNNIDKWLATFQRQRIHKCIEACKADNHDMQCEKCHLWHDDTGCEAFGLDYTEIRKLHALLTEAEIPHTFRVHLGGYQVCYPEYDDRVCSAVLHGHSYGAFEGEIEIMGLLTPEEEEISDVCGDLTADDVFNRIRKHWEEQKK